MSISTEHLETEAGRKIQETVNRIAKGIRDPEASRKALERLAEGREEMRRRIGVQNIAVSLIREGRDE